MSTEPTSQTARNTDREPRTVEQWREYFAGQPYRGDWTLTEWQAWRAEHERSYAIVRGYFRGGRRVIRRNLTLNEAQAYCRDPETSSRTCKKASNVRRTVVHGPWFDGYESMYAKKGK